MLYTAANWKSNKTFDEAREWLETYRNVSSADNEVIVCVPFPYVLACAEIIKEKNLEIKLGVQDISPFPYGAYTGEVSVKMVSEFIDYGIVGHSERRKYFHETDQEVANKVSMLVDAGVRPILCVDEPYMRSQLAAVIPEELKSCVVAYEPLAAIGSGEPDSPEHANTIAEEIKQEAAFDLPVLYGGSVKPGSVASFCGKAAINGSLVGGASLDVNEWMELVMNAGA